MWVAALKEERAIFASPIAYATVAVYLSSWLHVTAVLFLNRTGSSSGLFPGGRAVPAHRARGPMRLFAEERGRARSSCVLTSAGSGIEIVLAKLSPALTLPALMLGSPGATRSSWVSRRPRRGPIYSGFSVPLPGVLYAIGCWCPPRPTRSSPRSAPWVSASCSG